jgi:hypothetical protein
MVIRLRAAAAPARVATVLARVRLFTREAIGRRLPRRRRRFSEPDGEALGGADVPEHGRLGERRVAWTCRAAIGLAIVGVFGNWRDAGDVRLSGFEGAHDGWLVVILGLVGLAFVGALARSSWLGVVGMLGCSAVMLLAVIGDMVDDRESVGGHAGWGAWLTALASAVLAAVALAVAAQRLRARARPGDRPAVPRI